MTDRTIVHETFVIERTFPASVERVFQAFADREAKVLWFGGGEAVLERGGYSLDFRVGGREHLSMAHGESTYDFDVTYMDIVPDQRIVYSYDMHVDGRRMSASLATIEVWAEGDGTRLVVTEMGAYLDGLDTRAQREHGTIGLMDKLGESLGVTVGASA